MTEIPAPPEAERTTYAQDVIAATGRLLTALRLENPQAGPTTIACMVLSTVGQSMADAMPLEAVRDAFLMALDESHVKAMNFIEIGAAKDTLQKMADARRKNEGSGLILPFPEKKPH